MSMYKLSPGVAAWFSFLASPACVKAGFKLCIYVFLKNVFIPGARLLLARKRKVRCSVKCVFTMEAGFLSVVATGQVHLHVPLLAWYAGPLKGVKSCAVLSFSQMQNFLHVRDGRDQDGEGRTSKMLLLVQIFFY